MGIELCGSGLVWALIIALARQFIMFIPNVTSGNVLPTPSANYMHAAKLMRPVCGFLQVINGLLNINTIALLATVFATYAGQLAPETDLRVFSIGAIAVFTIASLFGAGATEKLQRVVVVILLTTLSAYVVMGIPAIRPDYLSLREVILPDAGISTLFAASAIVGGSMQGGEILMNFTEEIDNPRRNIRSRLPIES